MVEQMKWVERKFNFDFPVGLFPNVVERLRGTPVRLEEYARSLSRELLVRQLDGAWSVQEHIGHLLDLDDLHEDRLNQFASGVEVLVAADMQNQKTYAANYNAADVNDILTAFRRKRLGFVARLDGVDAETAGRSAFHPRLKTQMRLIDMVYFAAEHDDHHLAAIKSLMGD